MKYVLLTGNLTTGFAHIGPFDSMQEAQDWAAKTCPTAHSVVATLFDPLPAGRKVMGDWEQTDETKKEGEDL